MDPHLCFLGAGAYRDFPQHSSFTRHFAASYRLAYDRICKYEVILGANRQAVRGMCATDIAKWLIDYGIHPPTIYFPLTVPDVFMIEPSETESEAALDELVAAMEPIENPDLVRGAPYPTPLGRLDEVAVARRPVFGW